MDIVSSDDGEAEQPVADEELGSLSDDSISTTKGKFGLIIAQPRRFILTTVISVIDFEDPQSDILDLENRDMLPAGFDEIELQGARDYDEILADIGPLMDVMAFDEDVESESEEDEVPRQAPGGSKPSGRW